MEKLKILNLISVLKNLNKKELTYVLSQTNTLELANIFNNLKCHRCTSLIGNHYNCTYCGLFHCDMFYNTYDKDYTCLECINDLQVEKCLNSFIIKGKYGEFIVIYTDDNVKEGPITKEEALKLLKKYANFYFFIKN